MKSIEDIHTPSHASGAGEVVLPGGREGGREEGREAMVSRNDRQKRKEKGREGGREKGREGGTYHISTLSRRCLTASLDAVRAWV